MIPFHQKNHRLLARRWTAKDRALQEALAHLEAREQMLEAFFGQSLDGFYIALLDAPLDWKGAPDKAAAVEWALDHTRITKVNQAMLDQYGMAEAEMLGHCIRDFYRHDEAQARSMMADFLDAGHRHYETYERRADGTPIWIEGDYLLLYDAQGRVVGNFGIQRDITERKEAMEGLRRSEAWARDLWDSVNDALFVHDRDTGAIVDVNRRTCELYGYTKAELLRLNVEALSEGVPPYSQAEAVGWLKRALVQGPQLFRWRGMDRTGRVFWLEVNMRVARIQGRERILVAARDVDQRVRAEEALLQSERKFHAIFNQTYQLMGVLDVTGILLEVNETALTFIGQKDSEVLGKPFWETPWFADFNRKAVKDAIEEAARGRFMRMELFHVRHDGAVRIIDFSLKPVADDQGRVVLIIPEGRDITERREQEQEQREQEALFRLLFDRSADPNLLLDGDRFVDCNHATVTFLRAPSREQVLSLHPWELSPDQQPDGQSSLSKAQQMIALAFDGGSHRFEWMHRRLDGSEVLVDVLLTAIPWQGRRILHTSWRDLSERVAAEAERRNLEAQVLQSQKLESLGVLAGGIAHDFNNLLTAILGNLNLAQASVAAGTDPTPFLASAEQTTLKASELTKQMLAYSGRSKFVVRRLDLNQVVQELTQLLSVSISKKVALELKLASSLPVVEADVAQLHQVILNLVTNASDAIGEAEGKITVSTAFARLTEATLRHLAPVADLMPGAYVVLTVTDTGCGIPEHHRATIFDPFFTTKPAGRGLGLSAMLGILRAHGAGLEVTSEVGEGSTFRIYFPAAEGAADALARPVEEPSVSLQGTVLLVDDEPMVRETTRAALELLGFQVIEGRDGVDALEQVDRHGPPDLVLMDLTMPRMDGRETFLALRARFPQLPVLLSSGYDEQESLRELLEQGLAGFIQKPYRLKDLRRAVEQALAQGS